MQNIVQNMTISKNKQQVCPLSGYNVCELDVVILNVIKHPFEQLAKSLSRQTYLKLADKSKARQN